jgi:uncharacterized protein with HEPN domain
MTDIRDKLIHHYLSVNLDIMWQVVTEGLPQMMVPLALTSDEEVK